MLAKRYLFLTVLVAVAACLLFFLLFKNKDEKEEDKSAASTASSGGSAAVPPAPAFGDLPELGKLNFLVKAGGSELTTVVTKAPVFADLKGFEVHTHVLPAPTVFTVVTSRGRDLQGLPSEGVLSLLLYFWLDTPLLLRLNLRAAESGEADKFFHFVNLGEHGNPRWEVLELETPGVALSAEELKAKLKELNANLGNVGAVNLSKSFDSGSAGKYVVEHDSRSVTVNLLKRTNPSLGFTLYLHKFLHPSVLGKVLHDGPEATFPDLPYEALSGLSVYWWNDTPLLLKLNFHDPWVVDNVYFVKGASGWDFLKEDNKKVTRRLTNGEIEKKIDELNFTLNGLVSLHLENKTSYAHLSTSNNVNVAEDTAANGTAGAAGLLTGFKKYVHTKVATAVSGQTPPSTFKVGKYFYKNTLAFGLPTVPVKSVAVFFVDNATVPLLVQVVLPPEGEASGGDITLSFQNNGDGTWSEFSLDAVAVPAAGGTGVDANATEGNKLNTKLGTLKADFGDVLSLKIDSKVSYDLNKPSESTSTEKYVHVEVLESPFDFFGFSGYVHLLSHKTTATTTTTSAPERASYDKTVFTVDQLTFGDQALFGLQVGKASKMTVFWLNDKVPVLADVYDRATHKYFYNMNDGNRWALHGVFEAALESQALSSLLFKIRDRIGNPVHLNLGHVTDKESKYLTNGTTVKVEKLEPESFDEFAVFVHTSSSSTANLKVGKVFHNGDLLSVDLSALDGEFVSKAVVYCKKEDKAPLLLELHSKPPHHFVNNWDGSWSPFKFVDHSPSKVKEKLVAVAGEASKVPFLDLSKRGEYTSHNLSVAVTVADNATPTGYKKVTHAPKPTSSPLFLHKFVHGNSLLRGLPLKENLNSVAVYFKTGDETTPLVVEVVKPVTPTPTDSSAARTKTVFFKNDGGGSWLEAQVGTTGSGTGATPDLTQLLPKVHEDLAKHLVVDVGKFGPTYLSGAKTLTVASSDLQVDPPAGSAPAPPAGKVVPAVVFTKYLHRLLDPPASGTSESNATPVLFRLKRLEHNTFDLFLSELPLSSVESVAAFCKKSDDKVPLLVEVVTRDGENTNTGGNAKKHHYFHVNKRGAWVKYVTLGSGLTEENLKKKLVAVSERLGKLVTLDLGKVAKAGAPVVYNNEETLVTVTLNSSSVEGLTKQTHVPSLQSAALPDPDVVFTVSKLKLGATEVGGLFFGRVVRANVFFLGEKPILVDVYTGYRNLYFARDANNKWWEELIVGKTFAGFLDGLKQRFPAELEALKAAGNAGTSTLRGQETGTTVSNPPAGTPPTSAGVGAGTPNATQGLQTAGSSGTGTAQTVSTVGGGTPSGNSGVNTSSAGQDSSNTNNNLSGGGGSGSVSSSGSSGPGSSSGGNPISPST